jgi:hypothetical protein
MKLALICGLIFVLSIAALFATLGAGSFKRMVTVSGVYSICKPDDYEVVCFLDADASEGGVFCLPLSQVGGECKK